MNEKRLTEIEEFEALGEEVKNLKDVVFAYNFSNGLHEVRTDFFIANKVDYSDLNIFLSSEEMRCMISVDTIASVEVFGKGNFFEIEILLKDMFTTFKIKGVK